MFSSTTPPEPPESTDSDSKQRNAISKTAKSHSPPRFLFLVDKPMPA
jgi:hypothetical protein